MTAAFQKDSRRRRCARARRLEGCAARYGLDHLQSSDERHAGASKPRARSFIAQGGDDDLQPRHASLSRADPQLVITNRDESPVYDRDT